MEILDIGLIGFIIVLDEHLATGESLAALKTDLESILTIVNMCLSKGWKRLEFFALCVSIASMSRVQSLSL